MGFILTFSFCSLLRLSLLTHMEIVVMIDFLKLEFVEVEVEVEAFAFPECCGSVVVPSYVFYTVPFYLLSLCIHMYSFGFCFGFGFKKLV